MEERVEHDIEEEPEQRTEPQVTKRVYTRGENVTFKPQTTRYGRTSIPRISKTSSALASMHLHDLRYRSEHMSYIYDIAVKGAWSK